MNNTFKMTRLGFLLRKQGIEYRKIYFATTVILFGLIALIYAFSILTDSYSRMQIPHDNYELLRFSSLTFREPVLIISGMFYLCFLSGHYFSNLDKASTAIQELTLPVSTTERLVCSFLLSTVLTTLTFVVVLLVVDTSAVSILRESYKGIDIESIQKQVRSTNYYGYENRAGFKFILQALDVKLLTVFPLFALFISSVFTLGSIYFSRLSFMKTSFVVVLFLGGVTLITTFLSKTIRKGYFHVQDTNQDYAPVLSILFNAVIVILLVGSVWAAIYFRLKEKEV